MSFDFSVTKNELDVIELEVSDLSDAIVWLSDAVQDEESDRPGKYLVDLIQQIEKSLGMERNVEIIPLVQHFRGYQD